MKVIKHFLSVALLTSGLAIALPAQSGELAKNDDLNVNLVRKDLARNAEDMRLSLAEYLEAGKRYGRLREAGGLLDNALPLNETIEFQNAFSYVKNGERMPADVKKAVLALINKRKANLATYLGIDVTKVDEFIAGFDADN